MTSALRSPARGSAAISSSPADRQGPAACAGTLPPEYVGNLLKPTGSTLDSRFLSFTGLDAEKLREAILAAKGDDAVLAWVERHAIPHTASEKEAWADEIATYRPTPEMVEYRKKIYPELAGKVDLASISVLDMIDMDEGGFRRDETGLAAHRFAPADARRLSLGRLGDRSKWGDPLPAASSRPPARSQGDPLPSAVLVGSNDRRRPFKRGSFRSSSCLPSCR